MLDLYTWATPNGHRVSIMLEELGASYVAHSVDLDAGAQFDPAFLALSPNNKIPVLVDSDATGAPRVLFESGAILVYLAEKTQRFMPTDAAGRYHTLQWLMFQMGGVGPMFGQVGFFHRFAGKEFEDKRPRDRYVAEAKRLLGVLEQRLQGHAWIVSDDYSIADIAIFPWVRALVTFYEAGELVGMGDYPAVTRALEAFVARPAVVRGMNIPERPKD